VAVDAPSSQFQTIGPAGAHFARQGEGRRATVSNIVQFPLASTALHRPTAHVGARLLREPPAHAHAVQFYDDDSFLCETVAFFLESGLDAGDAAVVIGTAAHGDGILARLSPSTRQRALDSGELVVVDAEALLARFTVGDEPGDALFIEAVERMINDLSATLRPERRVHLFGEMVDVLWRQGKPATAIRLEDFWSRFTATHAEFVVLCAYGMRNFYKSDETPQFAEVCRLHTHVLPTERFVQDRGDGFDRLREISVLEQRARLLQNEVQYREELESALREALAERSRVQRALDASLEREHEKRIFSRLALTSTRVQRGIEQILTIARERLSDRVAAKAESWRSARRSSRERRF
jgi:hypothetical protein